MFYGRTNKNLSIYMHFHFGYVDYFVHYVCMCSRLDPIGTPLPPSTGMNCLKEWPWGHTVSSSNDLEAWQSAWHLSQVWPLLLVLHFYDIVTQIWNIPSTPRLHWIEILPSILSTILRIWLTSNVYVNIDTL